MGDTPNPVTGLTGKELAAVRESWSKLKASWKTYGPEYFCLLFEDPNTLKYFKTFDGMSMEEIRPSAKLRAHAINFGSGLNAFVENLEDIDCLIVLIHKQTANHFRRDIRIDQFREAFRKFVIFAQSKLPLDELTVNAWKKTLDVVESVMDNYMKELDAQTNDKTT